VPPIRVAIADDHPLFRSGLRALLSADPSIDLVGEASNGAEAVELVERSSPDVVLVDLTMPELDGIEATRRIVATRPTIAVLVLTMLEDQESLSAAIRAGARGYLVKGADGGEVLRAVHGAARGDLVFSAEVADGVLDSLSGPSSAGPPFPQLSEREREILHLMAQGHPNTEIAQRVYLTHKTVRNYVSSIFRKLGVDDRVEAVLQARQAGLGQRPAGR
jgi:DNA-binding NarL/FixJ family response regulator